VKKNLVLLGMMGVGKTTIAKMVAKKQNLNFIDTDQNVQNENLMSIYEMFEKKGESFFRKEEEKEVLKSLKKTNCIIALGGGAFINKTVRENILNNAISIWLDLDVETLNSRIKQNYKRPLLKKDNNQEKLRELYTERKKIYQLANHKIDCAELNKDDICKKVIEIYEQH